MLFSIVVDPLLVRVAITIPDSIVTHIEEEQNFEGFDSCEMDVWISLGSMIAIGLDRGDFYVVVSLTIV
jgi:hypothetical protein